MSEIPRSPDTPDKPLAEVVNLDAWRQDNDNEMLDPYELSDAEAVEFFLSELAHPSRQRSSAELGEYISAMLGPFTPDDVRSETVIWRTRLLGLMVDIDQLDNETFNALLDADPISRDIHVTLIEGRDKSRTMKAERSALLLLRDLRAGVVVREDADPATDERWHRLISRLDGENAAG